MIRPTIETVWYSPFVCVEYYVSSRPTKSPSVGVGEILISLDGLLELQLPSRVSENHYIYKRNEYFVSKKKL